MSEKAKQMLILFAGTVVISGIVTVQVRRGGPAPPLVVSQAVSQTGAGVRTTPVSPGTAPTPAPPVAPSVGGGRTTAPDLIGAQTGESQRGALPAGEWGRNPFLTPAEIAALAPEPLIPEIINVPEPLLAPLPGQLRVLPQYTVSVIIAGEEGAWAVVDSRVVRPGDRIGEETVSQINEHGVVLESAGETRQVGIHRPDILAPR